MDRGQDASRFFPRPHCGGTGSSRGRTSRNSLFDRSRIRPTFVKLPCWSTECWIARRIAWSQTFRNRPFTLTDPVRCVGWRSDFIVAKIRPVRFVLSTSPPLTPQLRQGLTQQQAMERFHVRAGDGRVLSGAAAFVEVWSCLPGWRWAARAVALPGALAAWSWATGCFFRSGLHLRAFLDASCSFRRSATEPSAGD